METTREKGETSPTGEQKNVVNHFAAGANCQVFNGPVSGCVFAMPGSSVIQQRGAPTSSGALPEAGRALPRVLMTDEAKALMARLVDAGLLTDQWEPRKLSGTECGLLAKLISERLGIDKVWQVFGSLWGEKPQTLRSYFNKAYGQRKSLQFQDRLKNILG